MSQKEDKLTRERKGSPMLLALTLTTVWICVMVLVVAACRMAARGDEALEAMRGERAREAASLDRGLRAAEERGERWEEVLLGNVVRVGMKARFNAYRVAKVEKLPLQPTAPEYVRDGAEQDLDVGP